MDPEYPFKPVFITEDLSAYERVEPDEFPDFDHVDSREIDSAAGYEGPPDAA